VRLPREAHPTAPLGGVTEMTFHMQTETAWLQCWSFKSSIIVAELYGNAIQVKKSLKSQYVGELNTCHLINGENAPFSNKCYTDIMHLSCLEGFNSFCTLKNSSLKEQVWEEKKSSAHHRTHKKCWLSQQHFQMPISASCNDMLQLQCTFQTHDLKEACRH